MDQKNILYFDCSAGISGDMTLGALLDLGADREEFLKELQKLPLEGYRIETEMTERNFIRARQVKVILEEEEKGHSHEHGHEHSCDVEHTHTHDHEHAHTHSHDHIHRSFRDIREMIRESGLSEEVKDLALRIFSRVARAEARVHGKPVDEVQFHEVGAVDSIVDIVGCAILISQIRPDHVYASVVQDGHGFVHCQHGLLSVPVPAVSEIFAEAGVTMRQIDVDTELVTPTGAAIIAELTEGFGPMPEMKLLKTGWGAGTKRLSIPNVLKIYQGTGQGRETEHTEDQVLVLETNLDDCTGEMLGFAMEELMKEGALDVFYTPIYMKKNRPAWKLTVLARPEAERRMEQLIFSHTTTIGIRKRLEKRRILKRKQVSCRTAFGEMEGKQVVLPDGQKRIYLEYESAVKLALENQVPLWEILGQKLQE